MILSLQIIVVIQKTRTRCESSKINDILFHSFERQFNNLIIIRNKILFYVDILDSYVHIY